jgi:hypothetical protein
MDDKKTAGSRVNSFTNDADIDASAELTDFQPKVMPTSTLSKNDIDKIAKETGFVSRQSVVSERKGARRYTTGRNQQLNIKVTGDTLQRFMPLQTSLGSRLVRSLIKP